MAFFVTGAIIAGGAGLISAGVGAYASGQAADKQAAAANNALNFQKQTFDTNQTNMKAAQGTLQPYMDVGKGATYTLGQLTGGNGNQPDYSSFYKDPSYNFAQQQGELGIERGANARGLNLSGGTLKDLATFNSGLASQQYGNYFNRLMGLSQIGQNATNTNANLVTGNASNNTTSAGQIGNSMQGVGQAQASGIVGGANAITGGLNSGVSNALLAGYLGKNASGYGNPSYGGGSAFSGDAYGGSSSNPLAGLNKLDYGGGY
jgi:hypothetical protein